MVQDKISGARRDLTLSLIKPSTIALGYFVASFGATLIICFVALGACLGYLSFMGWYLSAMDVFLLVLDVVILALFGTALSSLINCNLSTNGQGSAVGTIVSAGYGFICGAYMPISNFGEGLQKVLSFFPGTYGTSLLRNHALRGAYAKLSELGVPEKIIEKIKDGIDCNIYFFGDKVELSAMYGVMVATVVLLILGYVLLCRVRKEKG